MAALMASRLLLPRRRLSSALTSKLSIASQCFRLPATSGGGGRRIRTGKAGPQGACGSQMGVHTGSPDGGAGLKLLLEAVLA